MFSCGQKQTQLIEISPGTGAGAWRGSALQSGSLCLDYAGTGRGQSASALISSAKKKVVRCGVEQLLLQRGASISVWATKRPDDLSSLPSSCNRFRRFHILNLII